VVQYRVTAETTKLTTPSTPRLAENSPFSDVVSRSATSASAMSCVWPVALGSRVAE
jgi:hypothetical protein